MIFIIKRRNYKMTKKNIIRAMVIAASLGISTPIVGSAATERKQYGEENYPDWFNKLIDFSGKAEEKINEHLVNPAISTTDQMRTYDIDKLMLITDEKRHSYFINKDSIAKFEWNYYYDEKGNTIDDVTKAIYKENRKMYISITDPNTSYVPRTFMNLQTGEVTTNYQEWEELFLVYDEGKNIKYIVYPNPNYIIPEKYLNAAALNENKLSIKEIKSIESELNQYSYRGIDFDQQSHQNPILRRQR